MRKKPGQKIRWLRQALILSIVLNCVLTGVFFYFLVREIPYSFTFDFTPLQKKGEKELSYFEGLNDFFALSFSQLVEKLENKNCIGQGYAERDMALALLTTHYFIDVKKALHFKNISARKVRIEEKEYPFYPGLLDEDFILIRQFIQNSACPLTGEGIHKILKKNGLKDPSLVHALSREPEVLALQTLFSRSSVSIKKSSLLTLALEVEWKLLADFLEQQKRQAAFSEEDRREFLRAAIGQRSSTASQLILILDYPYAFHELSDEEVCTLLLLTQEKSKECMCFAKEIIGSLRGDEVRALARKKLEEWGAVQVELVPKSEEKSEVVKRFDSLPKVGELRPVFRSAPPAAPAPQVHVIQPGESLWTIAHKYHVSVDAIMAINHLNSQTIHPGKMLKIPFGRP